MKLEFTFKAVASPKDSKTTIISITSITTEKETSYAMPSDVIDTEYHKTIRETNEFKKVKKSLEKRGDEVSIWMELSKELEQEYVDEYNNMQFGGKYQKKNKKKRDRDKYRTIKNLRKTNRKIGKKRRRNENKIYHG